MGEDLTNKEIARLLKEMADLMEVYGENKFKIRAYSNASRIIAGSSRDITELAGEDRLQEISGIGKGIAGTIKEIVDRGFSTDLEELRSELPAGVLELLIVPGLGPKKAHQLYYQLEIQDLEELKKALLEGRVRKLSGFGPRTEEKLLKSLEEIEQYQGVVFLAEALGQAAEISGLLLEKTDIIQRLEVCGSTRRQKELIGDLDILLAADEKEKVNQLLINLPPVREVLVSGSTKTSIITKEGLQVDFRMVSPEDFPVALQYFTGSREHNLKLRQLARQQGLKLNEYGLFSGEERIEIDSEEAIYHQLGLQYIIPELREDRGEIEAAGKGELPESLQLSEIKGDLHLHTRYSDGAFSLEEMVEAARTKGYSYLAITDHSQSLKIAHGMPREILLKQIAEIERLQEKYQDITILKGIEVDILADGRLDYDDEILDRLDLVIASIHSGFNQSEEQITARIIAAMHHPAVNIIGHPQGRILGRRKAYAVDMEKVIKTAAETGTCLEINSSPYRLDLNDSLTRQAKRSGVKIAISTDAHHIRELDDLALGVGVARRGWLTKKDVINTMEIKELRNLLRGG